MLKKLCECTLVQNPETNSGIHLSLALVMILGDRAKERRCDCEKQPFASTSWWRSWSVWLRILGVVVALVVGLSYKDYLLSYYENMQYGLLMLMGIVSAGLIRSLRSLIIVPVTFCLGLILHAFLLGGLTNVFDLVSWITNFKGLAGFFIWLVPVLIGVGIGTATGMMIEKQMRH